MTLFEYPKSAAFGRVLPKSKIYEHAHPSSAMKELFVRQVEQIAWQYKLAPETINLKGTRSVPEIQIFSIALKRGELKSDVLRCIDQAIPFPIFFELGYDGKIKVIATYKRPSEADTTKWVISDYFEAGWTSNERTRKSLPMALDLGGLYELLLERLIPLKRRTGETIQVLVERAEKAKKLAREIGLMAATIRKEKQFNRKVELNAQVRILRTQLMDLQ